MYVFVYVVATLKDPLLSLNICLGTYISLGCIFVIFLSQFTNNSVIIVRSFPVWKIITTRWRVKSRGSDEIKKV